MNIIDWPGTLVPVHTATPWLEKQIASSGATLTGQERVVVTDAGRWRYAMSVPIRKPQQVLAFRALMALTQGKAGLIRVPFCDCRQDVSAGLPLPKAAPNGVAHSDGAPHADGTGYEQVAITAMVATSAATGATSVQLTLPSYITLQPGQMFSDGDRAYVVQSVAPVTGSTYTVRFLPRLRAPLAAMSFVDLDRLSCVMRLTSEDALRADLQLHRFADLEFDFTEAIL